MDLRNCPECGKVFVYTIANLCPACREEEEMEFTRVKEYLYENPKIGIYELAGETQVDEAKIVRWIREGRIEGKNYSGLAVPCERCGKSIFEGRYCPQCSNDLAKGFSSITAKTTKTRSNNKGKFHIFHRDNAK
ncbi:MAG: TIGR03826 family flagellar region protein [Peptococcales bacterium]|jgi:flagellar operon protein (TIGR03826 family)